jgi:hypothetical protein
MRLLFSSIHCYLDPSSGAALCTRELLELLAGRGMDCRVLTTGIPEPRAGNIPRRHANPLGASHSPGPGGTGHLRAAEVIDLSVNGVRVTLMPHELSELSGSAVDAARRAGSSTSHPAGVNRL